MRMITSPDSPAAKELARLHRRRGRMEKRITILEGPHLLMEALLAGERIRQVFCLPEWADSKEGSDLIARASGTGAEIAAVSASFMAKAATTDTPPPVLAVWDFSSRAGKAGGPVGLVLDGLQDPGNLGSILRTAWAAGISTVWALPGTVDFYAPKTLRAGQGAQFHLAWLERTLPELLLTVRQENWWLAATAADGPVSLWQAAFCFPGLICIGSEARGIQPALRAAADEVVSIPMARGVDSLNAAVSAGIILFEIARRAGPN